MPDYSNYGQYGGPNEVVGRAIKECDVCKCELMWNVSGHITTSSSNFNSWNTCKDCMIEHCVSTECTKCKYYCGAPCRFLEMKLHYSNEE